MGAIVTVRENLNRHARLYGLIFIVTLIHCSVAFAAKWQPDVKTVVVNNYAMSYVERGHGKPLVLVHGVLSDYRTWLPLMKELSETSRVIAVSLRHFYPEHWKGRDDDFSLQQHADDVYQNAQAESGGFIGPLARWRGRVVNRQSKPVVNSSPDFGGARAVYQFARQ